MNNSIVISNFNTKYNPKKFLVLLSGAVLVMLVIVATFLFIKTQIGALPTYQYSNNYSDIYSIKYFRNSEEKTTTIFNAFQLSKVLVGYANKSNKYPVALTIAGFPDNLINSMVALGSSACSLNKAAVSFSVYVPYMRSRAVFCSLGKAYYYSYFGSKHTVYFLQFLAYDRGFNPYNGKVSPSDIKSMPSISVMKQIVGSFRFVKQ